MTSTLSNPPECPKAKADRAGRIFGSLMRQVAALLQAAGKRSEAPGAAEGNKRQHSDEQREAILSLNDLTTVIVSNYRFDSQTYPLINEESAEETLQFALKHVILHYSKSIGQLATISEKADHSGTIDVEDVKAIVPKLLINTLRLSALIGLADVDLVSSIEARYSPPFGPPSPSDRRRTDSLAA
jgi:hypothetical protein